jgi:histone acetyltransferase (RNA polymerase elongator complex component)
VEEEEEVDEVGVEGASLVTGTYTLETSSSPSTSHQIKSSLTFKPKKSELVFPELHRTALIRELHVYGQLATVDARTDKETSSSHTNSSQTNSNDLLGDDDQQHVGFGTRLMRRAEEIAAASGYSRVAVISGVGVRNYYRKLGYELDKGEGEFMIKTLPFAFQLKHNKKLLWQCLLAVLMLCTPVFIGIYLAV